MLEPTSPILNCLEMLPISPAVAMHTIIGTGGPASCTSRGTGRERRCPGQPGVESNAMFTSPIRSGRVARNIWRDSRIRQLHAAELDSPAAPFPEELDRPIPTVTPQPAMEQAAARRYLSGCDANSCSSFDPAESADRRRPRRWRGVPFWRPSRVSRRGPRPPKLSKTSARYQAPARRQPPTDGRRPVRARLLPNACPW